MKPTDPLFPYKNLFITARPGMGATTLALNIVNKYLDEGKKCLVFEDTEYYRLKYIDRIRVIKENIGIDSIYPCYQEYGNLTATHNYIVWIECLLGAIDEHDADVIVYEEPANYPNRSKELIELAKELRRRGKIFIFVTHLKRRNNPFTHREKNAPSVSRHSRAIPHFDATAIVYRNCYYEDFKKADEDIEEIRIYERGKKKYRAVPVEFDFQHQRIKRK